MEEIKKEQVENNQTIEPVLDNEQLSEELAVEELPLRIRMVSEEELVIDERRYKVLTNYQEGLNLEMFNDRFSDVLNKYDYIVGDIGFEQLRLKGFYENSRKKAALDQRINALEDYLYEYCNFGCAYFVIEKINKEEPFFDKKPAHIKEKKGKVKNNKQNIKKNKQATPIKNQKPAQQSKTSRHKHTQNKNTKTRSKNTSPQINTEKTVERPFTIRRKEENK